MKRLAGKSTRTKDKVEQTLDVSKILGVDVSGNPRLVQEVGQALLDRIIDRTVDDNEDVSGNRFDSYSKAYRESEDWDEFGKSASDINLSLTGDMMDSLDFKTKGSKVTIKVSKNETGKAFGNISGIRGKNKSVINPRDWFGVSAKDVKKVKSKFKDDIANIKDEVSTANEQAVTDLLTVSFVDQESPEDVFNLAFSELFEVNDGS